MNKGAIILGTLAAIALGVGFASHWSRLGLLNALDGALSWGSPSRLAVRGEAYGADARQKLNIWVPEKQEGAAPVIVFFYGGSWKSGERDLYDFAGRALAEQGFVVVIPDYRLVPQVRFPAFVEDGAAAVAWAEKNVARFGGDPARITLSGHSAGAHIAAMLTLDQQWLLRAGASDGVVKHFIGLAGPYDFYPFTSDSAREAFAGVTYPETTQPISFARVDAPPMLLLHGSTDTTVKPRNSLALEKAMPGIAKAVILPGLDHSDIIMAFARPFRGKADVLKMTAEFARQ
jgi:acetyl esterase/lipase